MSFDKTTGGHDGDKIDNSESTIRSDASILKNGEAFSLKESTSHGSNTFPQSSSGIADVYYLKHGTSAGPLLPPDSGQYSNQGFETSHIHPNQKPELITTHNITRGKNIEFTLSSRNNLDFTKRPSKKPSRRCCFCSKHQTNLSKHLMFTHRREKEIIEIAKLGRKERILALSMLKKKGIAEDNEERFRKGKPPICVKAQKTSTRKAMCLKCKGIFARNTMYLHNRYCRKEEEINPASINIENIKLSDQTVIFDENFNNKIIKKLMFDDVGIAIRNNLYIRIIGKDEFERIKGEKGELETRKRVAAHMRRVCKLFITFNKDREEKQLESVKFPNIFDVSHLNQIEYCINILFKKKYLKSEAIRMMNSTIKKSSRVLISYYRELYKTKDKERVEEFLRHYKDKSKKIVSEYKNFAHKNLPRAENMADINDLKMLRNFALSEIQKLLNEFTVWNFNTFVRLRRAVACMLTFFNGRRPAEIYTLTVEDWHLAREDAFITPTQKNSLTEDKKQILKRFKIAFNQSKTRSEEVFILIPEFCFKALNKLSDDKVRKEATILASNRYLLSSIQLSSLYASSFDDLKYMCKVAKLNKPLCADKMRHFVSTEFGNLNVTPEIRNLFFAHLGHSKDVSQHIYQVPKALHTTLNVGTILEGIDDEVQKYSADRDEMVDQSVSKISDSEKIEKIYLQIQNS